MFKRLRERIAEEGIKFPVGQLSNNSGKTFQDSENKSAINNSNEDLITLSDSSSVVVPHSSSHQFSIGEEDASYSEQNTPQKTQNDLANQSNPLAKDSSPATISDVNYVAKYRPSKSSYVPQSDIESEREEPPTLNLDGISKEQLLEAIQALKARSCKYKNKYSEVVKNYKELRDEKIKIENTLIENQDKGLRRLAELREQCHLEQKAKAHLEANLRLLLEEKDSRISVLETQINLLKDSVKSGQENNAGSSDGDTRSEDSASSTSQDIAALQEKIERLHHQQNQDKKTITAQKDQVSLLRKQNESLSQELEDKMRRLNDLEEEQASMQERLHELEQQQEESVMAMAETKRNMHEELELKEKQLLQAEEEARQCQAMVDQEKESFANSKRQYDEKIADLQRQLDSVEKALEEEKQNVMQELKRGKTATINLMQQECAKKVSSVEEEWKSKVQELEQRLVSQPQHEESAEKLLKTEERLKQAEAHFLELEKENTSLKNSLERLESVNMEARHEESLTCMKDKLQNAEKNYRTQLDELKSKVSQLEAEKAELSRMREDGENKIQEELVSKKKDLEHLRQALETSTREQTEKIHAFQETMNDKENTILKLKGKIESMSREFAELQSKMASLEAEREQVMLRAQERVSATEAKCREEVEALQSRNQKLLLEAKEVERLKTEVMLLNTQLDESLLVAEANQATASKELSKLRDELSRTEEKLGKVEREKSDLSSEAVKLKEEILLLQNDSEVLQQLKLEKEKLNEQLKSMEQQVKIADKFESERNRFREENEELLQKLQFLKSLQEENDSLRKKLKALEESNSTLKIEIEKTKAETENIVSQMKSEILLLKEENQNFQKRVSLLESFDPSDPQNSSLKEYIAVMQGQYETAIKAKESEMEVKLKQLVKDFCIQMDGKDKDCDQIISELIEKNQNLEERLQNEHRLEISSLRQDLFEKDCALDEMRDQYEESLREKENKIKEQETTLKLLSQKATQESSRVTTAESSDWDDTWAVPDESFVENSSPLHSSKACEEHLQEIESLQEEVSKCNSEIKELKILLRLSPPESLVDNNNRRDSLHSIPEPTEFEYLKNIIYEYMMGKEPITLVKVIAAVLRFSDVQTQQVIRREETRHHTR